MTIQQIKNLKALRSYFGENDKTQFEHSAYSMLEEIIQDNESDFCPNCIYHKNCLIQDGAINEALRRLDGTFNSLFKMDFETFSCNQFVHN